MSVQVAGSPCCVCKERVATVALGRGCAACGAVFHLGCRDEESPRCPTCGSVSAVDEVRRIFAKSCMLCGLSNPDAESACVECGTRTAWNDAEELAEHREVLRRSIVPRMLRGIALIVAGGVSGWAAFQGIRTGELRIHWALVAATTTGIGSVTLLRATSLRRRILSTPTSG